MFYQYWVVRYVPDPIRGEFINIALLVGNDGKDWAFRQAANLNRANRLGGDPAIAKYWLNELASMVQSLQNTKVSPEPILSLVADSAENLSAGVVARLAARLNNAVQISGPYPLEATSASSGMSMLFEHLVEDPEVKSRERFGTRVSSYVSRELQRALPDGSRTAFRSRPQILVGAIPRTANFAIADSSVAQITNTWSFNLADVDKVSTEIQAWVAHMNRLRQRGGVLEAKNTPPLTIPADVQLRVVYEEPRLATSLPALRIAKEVWAEVPNLVAYPESEQDLLVKDALAVVA